MTSIPKPGPLPSAPPITLSPNAILQPPLSRRGHGPGLILLTPFTTESIKNETLDPLPLQKWAEEGYAVVEVRVKHEAESEGGLWSVGEAVEKGVTALKACDTCDDKGNFGVIGELC